MFICAYSRGIYSWNVADLSQVHFFVEFDHHSSAKRATTLQPPIKLCRVQSVAINNQLAFNFLSVAPPSSPSYNKAKRDGHWHKSAQEFREEQNSDSQLSTHIVMIT